MNLNNEFWRFCLSCWRDPQLAERAISDSINHQVDVVGVLFHLYCNRMNQSVDSESYIRYQSTYRPLIEQYRLLRRQAKNRLPDPLYQQQKQLELSTEQHYAANLYHHARSKHPSLHNVLSPVSIDLMNFAASRIDSDSNPH